MQQIEGLTIAVNDLQKEAKSLRGAVAENTAALRRRSYAGVLVALVLALIISVAVIQLTQQSAATREIANNNQKLCPMIALLLPRNGELVGATERPQRIAAQATELYRALNCKA